MKTSIAAAVRRFVCLHLNGSLLLAVVTLVPPVFAQVQSTGSVRGTVRNSQTGAFLEGAEVRIAGSTLTATTQRSGEFLLPAVPAGRQTVQAFYTGLDLGSALVEVVAGRVATADLALSSEVYKLEAYTVAGEREGNAVAITKQRTADNIVNVISTDAYGNIADGNIGTFMQRLPGVAAIYAEGDIIGVGLRGSPPDQSSLSIDGALMTAAVAGSAANVQGDRAPQLDRVPAELIKEIEVFKALMPDRDADGLGGAANLVTKSAFDFRNRVVTYRASLNHNLYRDGNPFTPVASFSFMDAFGRDRRLALTVSSSYAQTVNTRDRVQMQRNERDGRNTQARLLDDTYDRVRWGYGAKLEYKLGDRTMLNAGVLYSNYSSDTRRYSYQFNDTGTRRVADYNVVSRAAIEAGAVPRTTTNQTASVAPGFTDTFTEMLFARLTNQSAIEVRRGSQYQFSAGGHTEVAGIKLRAAATYSPAEYDNNFLTFTGTLNGLGLAIDTTRSLDRPVFRQTYGPSFGADTDFNRYTAAYSEAPDRTEEQIASAQLDAERRFAGLRPFSIKAGVKWREQHRETSTYRPVWNYVGADGVAGTVAATGRNDDNLAQFLEPGLGYGMFRGRYASFPQFDFHRVREALKYDPARFAPSGTSVATRPPPTEITESVTAGYVMGRMNLGTLQVVTGVRMEYTDIDALGTLRDPQAPSNPTIRARSDYRKYFPSVHLRYEPVRGLLGRASYSTSMARPSISQMTPNTTVTTFEGGLGTVTRNNPGLLPQYSKNYDVSLEYYFEPVGVLSGGAFRKDITDYIYSARGFVGAGAGNGFDGRYEGFDFVTNGNAGSAQVEGVELNYSQQLRFLPAPFNGLSTFANLTRITATGQFEGGAAELKNFVPRTINAGLSYRWRQWEGRAAWNHTSAFLFSFNADPLLRQYKAPSRTLDLNLQYRFRPWLQAYVDVVNVFNMTPNVYTNKDPRRVLFSEYFGARLTFGISGRF